MKKCNNCGFTGNPDDAHYCGSCGKPLEREGVYIPKDVKYKVVKESDYQDLSWNVRYYKNKSSELESKLNNTLDYKIRNLWHGLSDWLAKVSDWFERHEWASICLALLPAVLLILFFALGTQCNGPLPKK